MKRILSYVLAAALTLGTVGAANAIDLKVSGQWDFAFGWLDTSFQRNNNDDHFDARQRVRTQINFIASENLQAVLMFEIGEIRWGDTSGGKVGRGSGGDLDADGVNVETKRAYLDWMIPQTDVSVRMGIQAIAMPSGTGFCNPVLSSDVAGIVINAPITDMVGITAVWARPFDAKDSDGGKNLNDEMDIFALILPVTGEGWNVTPWGAYSKIGNASGMYDYVLGYQGVFSDASLSNDADSTSAWWAGLAVSVDAFDPVSFGFDVMYGRMNRGTLAGTLDGVDTSMQVGMEGWLIDARVDYSADWGTPGLFGWWSSGDKEGDVDDGMAGRMPVVGFDDGFEPTSFGSAGNFGINRGSAISGTLLGTWGVGAQIADVSFVEDLSHTLRVTYFRGTNDPEVAKNNDHLPLSGEVLYLTKDDSALEINFEHKYQIYENLAAYLDIGYIHLWMDEDVWSNKHNQSWGDTSDSNGWKAQLAFQYKF